MTLFLLNLLLALAWAALIGSFEPVNLLFGFLLGYLVLGMSEQTITSGQGRTGTRPRRGWCLQHRSLEHSTQRLS